MKLGFSYNRDHDLLTHSKCFRNLRGSFDKIKKETSLGT
jgi:hypothetical protein